MECNQELVFPLLYGGVRSFISILTYQFYTLLDNTANNNSYGKYWKHIINLDFGSLGIYSVDFRVCLYSHSFIEHAPQTRLILLSVQLAFSWFKNETVFLWFIKGLLCLFLSTQKLYAGSFTTKLKETKYLLVCVPRGDVVAIKSPAPISCLKETSDYKLSRHETCREASSDAAADRWVKEQMGLLLSIGYRTNLEAKDAGSGLLIS